MGGFLLKVDTEGSTQKLLVNSGFWDCERRTPLAIPKTGNNLLVHPYRKNI